MAPLKMYCLGWQGTHQVFLANYGSSPSSPYGTITQMADYAGVQEDALRTCPLAECHKPRG